MKNHYYVAYSQMLVDNKEDLKRRQLGDKKGDSYR